MPRPNPTAIGASAAIRPGVASSRSESLVQMSTTRPYSGFSVPSMIPGCSRNWRRTSKTMAPAARVTALIARPENMNTTAAPRIRPNRFDGVMTWKSNSRLRTTWVRDAGSTPVAAMAEVAASVYEPNRAVAASTAVAIAMPFVMALVVFPTASSSVRIAAPAPSTSPDISAIPWALSDTGPKVSIATMTPTVVSRPQPARATAKSETVTVEPPRRKAPKTAAPITSAVYTADSKPTARPERITVAAPVSDVLPTSWTG